MPKGRKAEAGTHEAREKIDIIVNAIQKEVSLSAEAKARAIKAVKFGLGIKEEKDNEQENIPVIKEKKEKKNVDETDEYFSPEECYEA